MCCELHPSALLIQPFSPVHDCMLPEKCTLHKRDVLNVQQKQSKMHMALENVGRQKMGLYICLFGMAVAWDLCGGRKKEDL